MLASLSHDTTISPPPPVPRYRTIAPIGRGGMAEVFLAVMTGAGDITKLAVLKQIWPELIGDPQFLTMLLDEARLSMRMAHPNLVQTYEVIQEGEGDRLAIAMEYLDGQPLGRVLNRLRGALSLPLRLRIVSKVLAGLDYAHELTDYDGTPLSVVHRDVSPHNVFVTYDGSVKLVDFGVAKSLASAHQTRPGSLKGKFSYMAPEQLMGRGADRRADIFAAGIMLWEILAGRRFWNGVSDGEIAAYLMSDRPLPVLPAELGLPPGVEAICARALQRDRDDRYATAAQMEADLEHVLSGAHDAYDRPLGLAVAGAFLEERAQRQQLIDRHVRPLRSGSYHYQMTSSRLMLAPGPVPSAPVPAPVPVSARVSTQLAARVALPWVAIGLAAGLPLLAVLLGSGGGPVVTHGPAAAAGAVPTSSAAPPMLPSPSPPAWAAPSDRSAPSLAPRAIPSASVVPRALDRRWAPQPARPPAPPAPDGWDRTEPAPARRHRRTLSNAAQETAAEAPAPAGPGLFAGAAQFPTPRPRPIDTVNPFLSDRTPPRPLPPDDDPER